jgi:TolB-like protein/tetratricopeptide (TPR) repeat protein
MVFRFGSFELDQQAGELRRRGKPVRLAAQPFRLLMALVSRAGQLVSREELRRELWGDRTFVDFELGLNYSLSRLRGVLGDDARSPKLIETVRGLGYRFVAPLESRRTPSRPTLAVLPFENLTHDPRQDYLADGLADLLTTELAKVSALRVISRQSVRHLEESTRSLAEIGRELGVHVVVEGTLLCGGDRLRFNVQVVEVEMERHVWAGSFEGELGEAMALQGQVAGSVAHAIAVALTPEEEAKLARRSVTTPEAQIAFLRARHHLGKWSRLDLEAALGYLQEAVAADPGFAAAHADLALCLVFLGFWGHAPARDVYPRGRHEALRAIELDPGSSAAHLAEAWVGFFLDWDLAAAEQSVRRALALNPSNETAHLLRAVLEIWGRGNRAAALAEAATATALDPVSAFTNGLVAWLFLFVGEFQRAAEQAERTLVLHPNVVQAFHVLGWAHLERGQLGEAVDSFQRGRAISRDPLTLAYLALALARVGKRADAEALLPELVECVEQGRAPARSVAILYAGLGDLDRAFEWLERAYQEHDPGLLALRVGPMYEPFRRDARFQALLSRMPHQGRGSRSRRPPHDDRAGRAASLRGGA